MTVTAALLPMVVAALLWVGPGWLLGEAVRLPRVLLVLVAPAVGLGTLSVVGQWSTLAGTGWSLVVALCGTGLLAAVMVAGRSWHGRRRAGAAGSAGTAPGGAGLLPPPAHDSSRRRGAWSVRRSRTPWFGYSRRDVAGMAVASILGGVFAGWAWWRGTSRLVAVNQDYDMPIHSNLVRLSAESGRWDPELAGLLNYYGTALADAPNTSYPIGFHALAALGWGASGLEVPVWLNVFVLMLLMVQLPLAAVALTMLVTRRPVALAFAGLVSGTVTAFPFDNLFRGPLLAFTVGMLLVGPTALLVVVAVQNRRWAWLPAVAAAVFGIFAVQPAALVVLALVLLPAFLVDLVRARTVAEVRGRLVHAGAAALLCAVLGLPTVQVMLRQASRVSDVRWVPETTVEGAISNVLLFTHAVREPQHVLTVAMVVGVVLVVHLRQWWYLVPWLVSAALYVYLDGQPENDLTFITGLFYGDPWRFLAMAAMFAVPLVALGLSGVAWWLAHLVGGRLPHRLTPPAALGAAAVLTGVAAVVVSGGYVERNAEVTSWNRPVVGTVLTPGEHELLSTIDQWVAPDENVLNQACDGSTWMYALGGRTPMIRNYETLLTRDQELLFTAFDEIEERPEVVDAAARLDIHWVYLSGGYIIPRDMPAPGLQDLDDVDAVSLVAQSGDARLYRLDWDRVPGGAQALAEAEGTQTGLEGVPGMWGTTEPQPVTADRLTCTW